MKNLCNYFRVSVIFSFLGCNDYFDIVPDPRSVLDAERKDAPYTLFNLLCYLPQNDDL